MEIRVFFIDESTEDYHIQTYYKNDDQLYTLVLNNGEYKVIDKVSHMVAIK